MVTQRITNASGANLPYRIAKGKDADNYKVFLSLILLHSLIWFGNVKQAPKQFVIIKFDYFRSTLFLLAVPSPAGPLYCHIRGIIITGYFGWVAE